MHKTHMGKKVFLFGSEASAVGLRIRSFEVGTVTTPNDTLDGERKHNREASEKVRATLGASQTSKKKKKLLSENSDVEQQMSEYCAHLFGACCVNGYENRQFSPSGRSHCQVSTMWPNWR